jgi:hypothetical protein
MLYPDASHRTRVLQKYRWPPRQLGFQPPSPEHTPTTHRRSPRRVCRPHPYAARYRPSKKHFPFPPFRPFRCLPRLILVDSTRAGKRLPDALSKTVPIWCAVVNRAARLRGLLLDKRRSTADAAGKVEGEEEEDESQDDDGDGAATDLRTPPGAVSAHEHAQIAARLEGWAAALAVRRATATCPTHQPLPQSTNVCSEPRAYRIRRMPYLNWPGRCARCGSHPRRHASRTSRRTRRSCPSYA